MQFVTATLPICIKCKPSKNGSFRYNWPQGRCALAADSIPTPEMMEIVYGELRRRAGVYVRGQHREHPLQPTALVHEAYMRMASWQGAPWRDRAHFIGVAALV